jgi:membrane protease YdiL (CAAX protease family)
MPLAPSPAQVVLGFVTLGLVAAVIAAWAWVIYRLATRQSLLPKEEPRYVPWDGKAVLAVLMTYIGLQTVVPALYVFLFRRGTTRGGPGDQLLVMILISVPFLAIGATILARWKRAKASDFGLELRRAPTEILRGIVAWPIVAPAVFGVNFVVLKLLKVRVPHAVESLAGQNPSATTWGMIFFAAVVVAPIAEEFLFRGVLLGWLDRIAIGRTKPDPLEIDEFSHDDRTTTDAGVWINAREPLAIDGQGEQPAAPYEGQRLLIANVMVSFVFAALHGQVWPSPIPIFVLALALGAIYQRTGSLIAPIALHMTFNGISTLMLYLITVSGGLDALRSAVP